MLADTITIPTPVQLNLMHLCIVSNTSLYIPSKVLQPTCLSMQLPCIATIAQLNARYWSFQYSCKSCCAQCNACLRLNISPAVCTTNTSFIATKGTKGSYTWHQHAGLVWVIYPNLTSQTVSYGLILIWVYYKVTESSQLDWTCRANV